MDRGTNPRYKWRKDIDIDPDLKDLVDGMLHEDVRQRLGTLVDHEDEDGDEDDVLVNKDIRKHRFFRGFPWEKLSDRTLAVSMNR